MEHIEIPTYYLYQKLDTGESSLYLNREQYDVLCEVANTLNFIGYDVESTYIADKLEDVVNTLLEDADSLAINGQPWQACIFIGDHFIEFCFDERDVDVLTTFMSEEDDRMEAVLHFDGAAVIIRRPDFTTNAIERVEQCGVMTYLSAENPYETNCFEDLVFTSQQYTYKDYGLDETEFMRDGISFGEAALAIQENREPRFGYEMPETERTLSTFTAIEAMSIPNAPLGYLDKVIKAGLGNVDIRTVKKEDLKFGMKEFGLAGRVQYKRAVNE